MDKKQNKISQKTTNKQTKPPAKQKTKTKQTNTHKKKKTA